ncbi:chromosome segregation protein SMC [Lyngbya confervoides]|uniref:Chromosome partition protein Smc n=1 Tax=Lyngbya confervoides BDU141951 TaxID=1574623 RepID=A0ABD4T0L0_9CYAN|nr:chromosome segregation protein SMC [Lyngbya confervoides]MCM1981973.1 chromosome segregation protein SMC [Lyngbya confervoides BDU141951]
MYVKQLELTNFKSFGGTTAVPTLKGFTVISGPNGSGKSNLLDAMLFALGLSGSKGMRAERLPDLVNHSQVKRGHSVVETKVTVSFALEQSDLDTLGDDAQDYIAPPSAPAEAEPPSRTGGSAAGATTATEADTVKLLEVTAPQQSGPEWRVTRRLRVTKQGTYTSTYAMNDQPCTLSELHQHLSRLRIYPEGYNVVLQGDVTGIITMNPRQRREIIDELAGVADFDRKILQARDKLEGVREQEERFRIVEQELVEQRDRLARDRLKAEKYRQLRAELHAKQQWEGVLAHRHLGTQIEALTQTLRSEATQQTALQTQIQSMDQEVTRLTDQLRVLNESVKALGEEDQLKIQGKIAQSEAELRQLERQYEMVHQNLQGYHAKVENLEQQILGHRQQITQQQTAAQQVEGEEIQQLTQAKMKAEQALEEIRRESQHLASSADAWVQQQSQLRQQIDQQRANLDPLRSQQVQLQERREQIDRQQQAQSIELQGTEAGIQTQQLQLTEIQAEVQESLTRIQSLAEAVAQIDQEVTTHQQTLERLVQEQRDKQRQLDRLEAQDQAQQEAQGTFASQAILNAKIPGVCGLVANLGRVEKPYQVALEIAAGARLGHLVVEDDQVAAAGIELLKAQRAGRATFLPLNKLKHPKDLPELGYIAGSVGYALDLIDFEHRYAAVFAYVLGNTVVFDSLTSARRHLGRFRMVTLDGDLLEPSGAMTGGSRSQRSSLKFGTAAVGESRELQALRLRLTEIDQLIEPLEQALAKGQAQLRERTQQLGAERQRHREAQIRSEQLEADLTKLLQRRHQLQDQVQTYAQDASAATQRLLELEESLPQQETALSQLQAQLAELEQSQAHGEWQTLQSRLRRQETQVAEREAALREAQQRLQILGNECDRFRERISLGEQEIQATQQQIAQAQADQHHTLEKQQDLEESLLKLRLILEELEEKIGAQRQARDAKEQQLRDRSDAKQQLAWQREKLVEAIAVHQGQLTQLQAQHQALESELPDPLPEIPESLGLEELKDQLKQLQQRLEAMEPVNMLAIEEYDRTQARLDELTQKLQTLEQERTELLLRVEKFTTLRLQAFQEAFKVVNENFQEIFGSLSDGDGFLQLENPEDPFQGGLNLVAHPKGKPVQRLASMSGGEKSLTALSFIFALQRYRPSPFYALDEVDSFLDGVNVEKLARTIQVQAQDTQFLVVSHRRPMIEAADRTIGVTQARGTHTQVIGMQLREQAANAPVPAEA